MTRIAAVGMMAAVWACSSSGKKAEAEPPKSPKDQLLEVLTDFSIAINANEFEKAADFLVDRERSLIKGGGTVSEEHKKRLKALRLQKLIINPRIQLVNGKLSGIYESLPILDHPGGTTSTLLNQEIQDMEESEKRSGTLLEQEMQDVEESEEEGTESTDETKEDSADTMDEGGDMDSDESMEAPDDLEM